MTDRELGILFGIGGIIVAIIVGWFFYFLGESKNVRRERERQRRENELPANVTKYSWEDYVDGAKKVGKYIIGEFKPDAILIFAGSSSIFSNLMLDLTLDRESLLATRVYTARFVSKDAPLDAAALRGYEVLENNLARLKVLLPEIFKLDGDRHWKVAIIDDTTTTGMSMQMVRSHLQALGYKNLRAASFTCVTRKNFNVENPIDFAYQYTTSNDFLFPWGKKPI